MITVKRLRILLLIYLAVVIINAGYGMWRGVSPIPHPLSAEQGDALASVKSPGPVFTGALTAISFTTILLEIWGWIGLFTLRASGRTCFIASLVLSFAIFPLLASWVAPASSAAVIGAGLVKLPGLLESLLGDLSMLLSGALVAITLFEPGSSLFKR